MVYFNKSLFELALPCHSLPQVYIYIYAIYIYDIWHCHVIVYLIVYIYIYVCVCGCGRAYIRTYMIYGSVFCFSLIYVDEIVLATNVVCFHHIDSK